MQKMRLLILLIYIATLLCGCDVKKIDEKKDKDLDFVVLREEEVPEEFQKVIERKKKETMRETYADGGLLYIAVGYGEKHYDAYKIEVQKCYESSNAICIHTQLNGPSERKIVEKTTYPYIVIRIKNRNKYVEFQ